LFNTLCIKLDDLLQTLWVGGLWVIGYAVAPILFASLDDRHLAGELAGNMFTAINFIGLVCGGYLLVRAGWRAGGQWFKSGRMIAIAVMLLIILVSMLVLQPIMQDLKALGIEPGSEAAAQFGRLHGVSSVLYLVMSLLGFYLVLAKKRG
jgi:MFS family permease